MIGNRKKYQCVYNLQPIWTAKLFSAQTQSSYRRLQSSYRLLLCDANNL